MFFVFVSTCKSETPPALEKRRKQFAKKLIDALHGEAWQACQKLVEGAGPVADADGYKLTFDALIFDAPAGIEKEVIIRETEAFDKYFERSSRRKRAPIDRYPQQKARAQSHCLGRGRRSSRP